MLNPIKVFSKVYVGFKDQKLSTGDTEAPLLGFLTPYEETSAGRKRIETVDNWSRPQDVYGFNSITREPHLIEKAKVIPAVIFDNVPLEGFEISRAIKRTGWNGGNVVWRVLDPRGFELEISSANLAKILAYATIDAGVIKGRCVWGRFGGGNVLMPEGCPEFANVITNAEELNSPGLSKDKKIKASEIPLGAMVKLKNGRECIYYGKWHILSDDFRIGELDDIGNTIIVRHVLKHEGYFYAIAELNAISVKKTPSEKIDLVETEKLFNTLKGFRTFAKNQMIKSHMVSFTKFSKQDVLATFKQIDISKQIEEFDPGRNYYFSDCFDINNVNKIENGVGKHFKPFLVGRNIEHDKLVVLSSIEFPKGELLFKSTINEKGLSTLSADFWLLKQPSQDAVFSKGTANVSFRGRTVTLHQNNYSKQVSGPTHVNNLAFTVYRVPDQAFAQAIRNVVDEVLLVELVLVKACGTLVTNTLHC